MAQVSAESYKEISHLTFYSGIKRNTYQASSKAKIDTKGKIEEGTGVFAWACLRSSWDTIEPSRKTEVGVSPSATGAQVVLFFKESVLPQNMKSFTARGRGQEKCSGSKDEVASHVCGPLPFIPIPIIPPLSHFCPTPFPLFDHTLQLTASSVISHLPDRSCRFPMSKPGNSPHRTILLAKKGRGQE